MGEEKALTFSKGESSMMNKELIKSYALEVYDEIVEYRRYLHAHPELSGKTNY